MYLDDILVFGPDFETTLARLESMLDRLGVVGPKLKAKKCQLFQAEIPFLGHAVSAAGIGADPAKCHQVQDWPVPRHLHEVRSFVGYARPTKGTFRVSRSWPPPCTSWQPRGQTSNGRKEGTRHSGS